MTGQDLHPSASSSQRSAVTCPRGPQGVTESIRAVDRSCEEGSAKVPPSSLHSAPSVGPGVLSLPRGTAGAEKMVKTTGLNQLLCWLLWGHQGLEQVGRTSCGELASLRPQALLFPPGAGAAPGAGKEAPCKSPRGWGICFPTVPSSRPDPASLPCRSLPSPCHLSPVASFSLAG